MGFHKIRQFVGLQITVYHHKKKICPLVLLINDIRFEVMERIVLLGNVNLILENDTSHLTLRCLAVLGAFTELRKATISFVISARPPAWNNSAPTRWILIILDN